MRDAAVRIPQKKALRGWNLEKLGRARRLLHAQVGKLEKPLGTGEQAAFDDVRIKLEGVSTGDPNDGHACAGGARANKRACAAERLVVRMRRDYQEHVIPGEAAELWRRGAGVRCAQEYAEQ
jgi:hypothetical protein